MSATPRSQYFCINSSSLWKISTPLPEWHVSAQVFCRERKSHPNFSTAALNYLDHEIASFVFLQSSISFIMQPPSPLIHTAVSSLPREQRNQRSRGKAVFDQLTYPHLLMQAWSDTVQLPVSRIISDFKRMLKMKHLTTHSCPAFLFKSQLPLMLISAQSLPSSSASLLQLYTCFLSLSPFACAMKMSSFLLPVPASSLPNVQLL